MPNLHSELANWDGKLSNPPVQDQTSQSSINSRNRLVSYPQAKYSSSSQQRVQGETRTSTSKESSVQNLVDRKRIETAKPGFSEGSYLTELLSSPRPRDIKNVASVSVTFVTQGVDNPSAAVNPIPLSSIVESAVNEAVETATVSDVFERRSQNNVIHRPPPDTVSPANQSLQPDDTQLVKTFNFAHESANLPLHTPLSISVHNVQDDYSTTLEHTFNVAFNSNASVCDTPQSPRFSGFRAVTSMDRSRPTRQITSHGKPDAASKSIQPDSLDVPLLNISPSFESSRDNEMEELMVNDLLIDHDPDDVQAGPSGSRKSASIGSSPMLNPDDSLFTPPSFTPPLNPPRKRRRREIMDYVAVPPFPKVRTRGRHKPAPSVRLTHNDVKPGVTEHISVSNALAAAHTSNALLDTGISAKRKGKQRQRAVEEDQPPPRKKYKPRNHHAFAADVSTQSNAEFDRIFVQTILPLPDLEVVRDPSDQTVRSNTRHIFQRVQRQRIDVHPFSPFSAFFGPLLNKGSNDVQSMPSRWLHAPPTPSASKTKGKTPQTLKNSQSPTKLGASARKAARPATTAPIEPDLLATPAPADTPYDLQTPLTTYSIDLPLVENPLDIGLEINMDEYVNDFDDVSEPHARGISHHHIDMSPVLAGDVFVSQQQQHDQHAALWRFSSNPVLGFTGIPDSDSPGTPDHHTWNGVEDPISSANSSIDSPAHGTIDPSLLGGAHLENSASQQLPPTTPIHPKSSARPIIYIRRPEGSHSETVPPNVKVPGNGKQSVQIKYRPKTSVDASDDDVPFSPIPDNTWTEDSDYSPSVDEQVHRPKRTVKMSLKLRLSKNSATRMDHADSDEDEEPAKKHEHQASESAGPSSRQKEPNRKPPKMGPTFCHQCRNKSDRDKMKCTSKRPDGYACGKLFCDRCVLNRYPEIDFDSSLNEWTCPHCLNICNCSHCAPRRGEKYISARGGGFAGAPTKNHVVLVPDKPAPSGAASAPPGSSHTKTFWATVYGLSGERVGQAFLGADSQLSIPRIPNTKPTIKPKRRRVFIGEPQPSWGVKAIKYLHNTHDDVSNERLAAVSRGNSVGGRQIRIYIGDRAALHEPFRRISDLDCDLSPLTSRSSSPDSDGTLTPLSELEAEIESWPQPDVGESCDWVPPPPTNIKQCVRGLSEEQVAKAIHDALAAVI